MLQMQQRVALCLEDIIQSFDVEVELGQFGRERADNAGDRQMEVRGEGVGQERGFVFEQAVESMSGNLKASGRTSCPTPSLALSSSLFRGLVTAIRNHDEGCSSHYRQHLDPFGTAYRKERRFRRHWPDKGRTDVLW